MLVIYLNEIYDLFYRSRGKKLHKIINFVCTHFVKIVLLSFSKRKFLLLTG